jgi:anti-anti-sigma factor
VSTDVTVAARPAGRAVIATLTGEIDRLNAADVEAQVEAAVTDEAVGLVLDLSDVTYLDSSGVHLVHAVARALRRRGQRLVLVRPRRTTPAAVLTLTGIDAVAPLHDGPASALEALGGA